MQDAAVLIYFLVLVPCLIFKVLKFPFNLHHVLLVSVDEVMLALFKHLAQTSVVVLEYLANILVCFLDLSHVLFYALEEGQILVSAKFVNGRSDLFNQTFEV